MQRLERQTSRKIQRNLRPSIWSLRPLTQQGSLLMRSAWKSRLLLLHLKGLRSGQRRVLLPPALQQQARLQTLNSSLRVPRRLLILKSSMWTTRAANVRRALRTHKLACSRKDLAGSLLPSPCCAPNSSYRTRRWRRAAAWWGPSRPPGPKMVGARCCTTKSGGATRPCGVTHLAKHSWRIGAGCATIGYLGWPEGSCHGMQLGWWRRGARAHISTRCRSGRLV
mmetsp:Transcript_55093/g.178450  ORF Transcript_55093/g.178450 Transcript_55093/m.178450 type:complete len:224 (+) Transcript_55093:235-906(+)